NDGAAVEVERREQVAGVGEVNAGQRDLGVAGPLVGEVVEDGAADLEEGAGADGVEVVHAGLDGERTAAALDVEGDDPVDGAVEAVVEGDEARDELTLDAKEDVTRLEQAIGDAAG